MTQQPEPPPNDDSDELDPAFYANGGVSISEDEQAALGDLHDKRVLLLGVGNGEDAASLVNLGGEVTAVDDLESMVEAKALAQAARLPMRFVEGSYAEIPKSLRTGGFDVAYTGFGGLGWVPDLGEWITGIREALEKDGTLVIYDEHPIAFIVAANDGQLAVSTSYFGQPDDEDEEDVTGEDEEDEPAPPSWMLGDIVTAVGSNGFAIELLKELRESDRFATVLDEIEDVPDEYLACVPGVFLLKARRLG